MHPIERYRKAKGLTQAALATVVDVATNTVQGWEYGREPRPTHLVKLAEALGVEPMRLFDEMAEWRRSEGKVVAA